MTHCCSNLAIQTDSFTLNPSCIFWMTCDTKYVQTSNLKLNFKNYNYWNFWFESILSNESAIEDITKNEKQTLILHQAKFVL